MASHAVVTAQHLTESNKEARAGFSIQASAPLERVAGIARRRTTSKEMVDEAGKIKGS